MPGATVALGANKVTRIQSEHLKHLESETLELLGNGLVANSTQSHTLGGDKTHSLAKIPRGSRLQMKGARCIQERMSSGGEGKV